MKTETIDKLEEFVSKNYDQLNSKSVREQQIAMESSFTCVFRGLALPKNIK